jgi:hypothetical protein
MANVINNIKDAPGVIAKMAAQMLADKTQFCKSIDKEDSSVFNGINGYQAGDTIQISKPARFIPSTSADVTSALQDIVEEKTSLTLDTRKVVPVSLTSAEVFTDLGLKKWTKRVLDPAMSSIANHVESAFLQKAADATYNSVGTAGSEAFTQDTMLAAAQKLYENGCTDDEMNNFALLNPYATRKAVVDRADLQHAGKEISDQYKTGVMGLADGFTYLRNNHLPTHTNGNDVTGVAVNDAAVAEGASTLAVDGLTNTTGTITKGTVFTIAGVYAVHPITKATLSHLQQFTVTADATANGSGQATISISPSLYAGSNGLQNVSALPADDAALVFVGAASTGYAQNLAFNRHAFRMVSVPLMTPSDSELSAVETVDGMTVRVWMQSDILTDKMIARIDFLGGLANVRPEWACRITS